jgi:hypothetical protein
MIDRGFGSQDTAARLAPADDAALLPHRAPPIGIAGEGQAVEHGPANQRRCPGSCTPTGVSAYRSLDRFSTIFLQKCRDRRSIEMVAGSSQDLMSAAGLLMIDGLRRQ